MFYILSILFTLSLAGQELAYVKRTITFQKNTTQGFSIDDYLDPGHNRMLLDGYPNPVYTPADVATLDTEAPIFYLEHFGLNVSSSNPHVSCSLPYPYNKSNVCGLFDAQGLVCLYLATAEDIEDNILVTSDSMHPERGHAGGWQQISFHNSIVMMRAGQFTSGYHAGQMYQSQSILTYGRFAFVKVGQNNTVLDAEYFKVFSIVVSAQAPPTFAGHASQPRNFLILIDKDGNRCEYIESSFDKYPWSLTNDNQATRYLPDHVVCRR